MNMRRATSMHVQVMVASDMVMATISLTSRSEYREDHWLRHRQSCAKSKQCVDQTRWLVDELMLFTYDSSALRLQV